MAKVDCIMDYYLGNKANILFLMGLVYRNNEYSNFILEPKNMQGAKVGCISNIILAIKEDVVENMGDLVYESKLFLNELEKAVAAIATKDGNGYKIDNYYFESVTGKPSRTLAYKQIGNAVPVRLANCIATALLDLFEKEDEK